MDSGNNLLIDTNARFSGKTKVQTSQVHVPTQLVKHSDGPGMYSDVSITCISCKFLPVCLVHVQVRQILRQTK